MGDNNNNNSNNNNNDILFFKFWRNIVIKRIIFNYLRLYIKNRVMGFTNIKLLREYGEREFISKIVYPNVDVSTKIEPIIKGDFPDNGILKEIDLSLLCRSQLTKINEIIPSTVEIIHFKGNCEIQLSELPLSVNTVLSVLLKKPYINNPIPTNIKTISFSGFNDPIQFYDIKLPNSIKNLNLICLYFMKSKLLNLPPPPPSFIPPSVEELNLVYIESLKSKLPIIPSTVKKLSLFICGGLCKFEKGFIPYGVKILDISNSSNGSFNLSIGDLPESLEKLNLNSSKISNNDVNSYNQIEPYSIPNSVLDLYIKFIVYPISYEGIFPNSLTKLDIQSSDNVNPPPEISKLPSTIKHLTINNLKLK